MLDDVLVNKNYVIKNEVENKINFKLI